MAEEEEARAKEKEGVDEADERVLLLFDAIAGGRLLELLAGRESVLCALSFKVRKTTARLAGAARVEAQEKNTLGLSRERARMQLKE